MIGSKRALLAALAIAAVGPPAGAGEALAQGSVEGAGYAETYNGTGTQVTETLVCQDPDPSDGIRFLCEEARSRLSFGGKLTGEARAVDGRLHAAASVDFSRGCNYSDTPGGVCDEDDWVRSRGTYHHFAAGSSVEARWDDVLSWTTGTAVEEVVFHWAIDGNWSLEDHRSGNSESWADWAEVRGCAEIRARSGGEGAMGESCGLLDLRESLTTGTPGMMDLLDRRGTTAFHVGGRSNLVFWASLALTAQMGGDYLFSATAQNDFAHTMKLTGVSFRDVGGNPISGVQYSFANGMVIESASPTVTPEPASMALLGTGLVGLVGAARRRSSTDV